MGRHAASGMRRFLVALEDLDAQTATAVEVAKAIAGPDGAIRVVHAYQMPAAAAVAGGSPPLTREACLMALRRHGRNSRRRAQDARRPAGHGHPGGSPRVARGHGRRGTQGLSVGHGGSRRRARPSTSP